MSGYADYIKSKFAPRGGHIMAGGNSNPVDNGISIDAPNRSKFDLSHKFRSTGRMGCFMPCLSMHLTPGDSVKMSANLFQRFQPLVSPVMTPIETSLHTFFTPYRSLDYGFEFLFTSGKSGQYKRPILNIDFGTPINDAGSTVYPLDSLGVCKDDTRSNLYVNGRPIWGNGSVSCDFGYGYRVIDRYPSTNGVKTSTLPRGKFNLLPLLAYHKIYNEYYRAENIDADLFNYTGDGDYGLQKYHYALETLYSDSLSNPFNSWSIEDLLNGLHSDSEFDGLIDFVLRVLTDPKFKPFAESIGLTSSDCKWYDYNTNCIKLAELFGDVHLPIAATDFGNVHGTVFMNVSKQLNPSLDANIYGRLNPYYCWSGAGESAQLSQFRGCLIATVLLLLSAERMPWERDEFNLALPYLQRGVTEYLNAEVVVAKNSTSSSKTVLSVYNSYREKYQTLQNSTGVPTGVYTVDSSSTTSNPLKARFNMDMLRNLSAATRVLEKSSRIGYKFVEQIAAYFGVEGSRNSELHPVYVGGLKSYADVQTVTSTADTENATLGSYAGQSTNFGDSDSMHVEAPEHGILISFYGLKPLVPYANLCDRNNIKFGDRSIFYLPDYAKLQEQPLTAGVLNAHELTVSQCDAFNGDVADYDPFTQPDRFFGYTPRYEEYRSSKDIISGELVSDLQYFTQYRDLNGNINNNYDFQHVDPYSDNISRIFNVESVLDDQFITEISFGISKLSAMPRVVDTL